MKISNEELKQIIKEELEKVLQEGIPALGLAGLMGKAVKNFTKGPRQPDRPLYKPGMSPDDRSRHASRYSSHKEEPTASHIPSVQRPDESLIQQIADAAIQIARNAGEEYLYAWGGFGQSDPELFSNYIKMAQNQLGSNEDHNEVIRYAASSGMIDPDDESGGFYI
jgi:hypothetical protein